MKVFCVFCALIVATAPGAVGADVKEVRITPTQQVVAMMNEMLTKVNADKHAEAVQFAAYETFCTGTLSQKEAAIEASNAQITQLNAAILADNAEVSRLADEIAEHHKTIVDNEADMKTAKEVRHQEHELYLTRLKDLTESIYACTEAHRVLQAQNYDRPGVAASLLQHVKAAKLPVDAQRKIAAFLAQGRDSDEQLLDQPVTAYAFRSADIITLLEDLRVKFTGEKNTADQEEVSKKHAYDLVIQGLVSENEAATTAISDKEGFKAAAAQRVVDATADLQAATELRDSDVKYKESLEAAFEAKTTEFHNREKMRVDEIEALEKAVEIISSSTVADAATKHLPSSLLQPHPKALAQLRATAKDEPNLLRAAAYLNDESSRIGSHMLAALAMRAKQDPFVKVKKMIEDLITKLLRQAGEEATHKGWCDKELGTNKVTREQKTELVETLTFEIEDLETSIFKLSTNLNKTSAEVAAMEAQVAEATDLRTAEKAANEVAIADAQAAHSAVVGAIQILQQFYGVAAKGSAKYVETVNGTSLAQGARQAPPIFDKDYKGLQDEKTGVLAMLDVIKSDFHRLEHETEVAERTASTEYTDFMTESAANQAALNVKITHMTEEKNNKASLLETKKEALEQAKEQLKSANDYLESLKPTCINTGQTYSERKMAREEEIQALQEALRILEGQDVAALQMRTE